VRKQTNVHLNQQKMEVGENFSRPQMMQATKKLDTTNEKQKSTLHLEK
jgi:hypothetical protein